MIKNSVNLSSAKDKIKRFLSKKVNVKVNLGRNKFANYVGTVTAVYPALFTVTPDGDFNGKTSFSFSEYACGIVNLTEV